MTAADWRTIQARLAAQPGIVVAHPAARLEDGTRVVVSYKGIETTGTIGARAVGWTQMKGINALPIILDGTGQEIEIDAEYVAPLLQMTA